ncbi:MAG: threonine synthase [Halioglobus sp.]
MSFVSHLQCTRCGTQYPADSIMNLCPVDDSPVEIIMDLERLQAEQPNQAWYRPELKSMWRFGALLPLDINDDSDAVHIFNLGEGHTPLLQYDDHSLALETGFSLAIKDEGVAHSGFGANPTGSFKDRGMAMTISMAHKAGISKLAVPTQGNAGDSLCEYVLAAGMQAVVAMPDNTPAPILDRVAQLASDSENFDIELVTGTIREAGALLKEKWLKEGYFSVATFQEPGWRIDGKKTLGLEIAEPRQADAPWKLPDVVIYPTGGGTGVLGMWKAWSELECLGLIDDFRPRVICVQSEATQPLVKAFESGAQETIAATPGDTLAYGVNVPGGVGHFRVLQIIRESGGAAVAVPEKDIHQTLSKVWKDKGWSICPEGAACLAAIPRLVNDGLIKPGNEVVVFNTGSLEKYLPDLQHLL